MKKHDFFNMENLKKLKNKFFSEMFRYYFWTEKKNFEDADFRLLKKMNQLMRPITKMYIAAEDAKKRWHRDLAKLEEKYPWLGRFF